MGSGVLADTPAPHELDEGIDGRERLGTDILILDSNAERLLDADHEFERIDGVQTEAIPKERGGIVDIGRRHPLKLESVNNQLFDFRVERP